MFGPFGERLSCARSALGKGGAGAPYRLVTPYSGATCKALRTLIINIFGPMKGVFRVFSPRTSRIRVAPSPKTLFFGSDVRFLYEGNRIRIGATVF